MRDKHIEDIDDPSQYFTSDPPKTDKYPNGKMTGHLCLAGEVELIRYSKMPNKYFAVELVEVRADEAVYRKRCWPDNRSAEFRVASTEQP